MLPPSGPLPKAQREAIWKALLNADWSVNYWGAVARLYQGIDRIINAVIAGSSCGAVATWYGWKDRQDIWVTLTIVTAVVSTIAPFFNFAGHAEQLFHVHNKWVEMANKYQQLWDNRRTIPPQDTFTRFQALQTEQVPLANECARLPQGWTLFLLKRKAQGDVLNSRGLPS